MVGIRNNNQEKREDTTERKSEPDADPVQGTLAAYIYIYSKAHTKSSNT